MRGFSILLHCTKIVKLKSSPKARDFLPFPELEIKTNSFIISIGLIVLLTEKRLIKNLIYKLKN